MRSYPDPLSLTSTSSFHHPVPSPVCWQYENLFFLIVASEQQSEPFLRRQMHLTYEMMRFRFGNGLRDLFATRQVRPL